ncbi:hypothetical protein C8Q75DRAFT_737264 [Abortiporus biennis]|nr:hypothetical protein C8Q75DRAFT_737264 [Abortiporus biennis]
MPDNTTTETSIAPAADNGETGSMTAATTRKRPRIDLTTEPRERKRGKTMFGLLVGTLNKAASEDKERNASDAAKKRQLIEQRLQDKLRKETDSVRRAEEAKKDKTTANRKEEELQLKDSIFKLRRTRLPLLANFLCTSDQIPSEEDDTTMTTPPPPSLTTANPLAPPPRSNPPALYYLPAILTPDQEAFLKRRKAEVNDAAEKEWIKFKSERATGLEEINRLRQRVAEEENKKKSPSKLNAEDEEGGGGEERPKDDKKTEKKESTTVLSPPPQTTQNEDMKMETTEEEPLKHSSPPLEKEKSASTEAKEEEKVANEPSAPSESKEMEVDEEVAKSADEKSSSEGGKIKTSASAESNLAQADEDDAVEY